LAACVGALALGGELDLRCTRRHAENDVANGHARRVGAIRTRNECAIQSESALPADVVAARVLHEGLLVHDEPGRPTARLNRGENGDLVVTGFCDALQ
jgi:hypothetical protein